MKLCIAKVSETNIAPRENVAYSKETQTHGLEPVDRDGKMTIVDHVQGVPMIIINYSYKCFPIMFAKRLSIIWKSKRGLGAQLLQLVI